MLFQILQVPSNAPTAESEFMQILVYLHRLLSIAISQIMLYIYLIEVPKP